MAVAGTASAPVLTMPGQSRGADLADCPLYPPVVEPVLAAVRHLIRRAQVPPYDVARRRGELKNVIVTVGGTDPDSDPGGTAPGIEPQLMLQLVLRTDGSLPRICEHLPRLLAAHPRVTSVWANLHPQHAALLTGAEDLHLAGAERLSMRVGDAVLHAGPNSFVQTNTQVAGALYRQVAEWAADARPRRVWDLYCGLGGFALHIARTCPDAQITGVEVSADAIAGAQESAREHGDRLRFLADDATAWAARTAAIEGTPDLVVVNPPRRGLGDDLCEWIEQSGVADVVYSSCNPTSLAADLARIPSLRITAARYIGMFPHTAHAEVAVRLRRITR